MGVLSTGAGQVPGVPGPGVRQAWCQGAEDLGAEPGTVPGAGGAAGGAGMPPEGVQVRTPGPRLCLLPLGGPAGLASQGNWAGAGVLAGSGHCPS